MFSSENSTGEGSEIGSDWMHLSIRKKTWAESVKERVAGEGLELLARSRRASGHGKEFGLCPKSTGKY